MTIGRCAGCGMVDASCSKVRKHVVTCSEYIALYKRDKAQCLDPTDEYVRWSQNENSDESRAEARTDRLSKRFAELDAKRLEQVGRWKPRDLLED